MNKIIEYVIVTDSNIDQVSREVNGLIAKGFQPLGGLSTTMDNENFCASQAMVKYEFSTKGIAAVVG